MSTHKIQDGQEECWVDIFEEPGLMGSLRRLYGPEFHDVGRIGSMIVGPSACVVFQAGKSTFPFMPAGRSRVVSDIKKIGAPRDITGVIVAAYPY
jgi:hypothetical protein